MWCSSKKRVLKKMTYIFTSEMLFFKGYILTVKYYRTFIRKE